MTAGTERRMVDVDDIVGVAELAALYRVGRSTVSNWPVRYTDFPEPIKTLAVGPIYSRTAVQAWHAGRTWQHAGPRTRERTAT